MVLQEEIDKFESISMGALSNYDESIKETFKLYNSALNYIKNGSEDIAIICLKKALSINDGFVEAHNLIALLYIYTKDYKKALQSLEKVLAIDHENQKASHYLDLIKAADAEILKPASAMDTKGHNSRHSRINVDNGVSQDEFSELRSTVKKSTADGGYDRNARATRQKNKKMARIKMVAYTFLLMAVLLIVFAVIGANMKDDGNLAGIDKKTDLVTKHKEVAKKHIKKVKEKSASKDDADADKVNPVSSVDNNVNGTDDSKGTNDKEDDKGSVEKDKDKDKTNETKDTSVAPQDNPNNFNTGSTLYKGGKYKESLPYLLSVEQSSIKDVRRKLTLFYIGVAYYQMNDKAKATEYYNKVKKEYPGSDAQTWLSWRIDKMK